MLPSIRSAPLRAFPYLLVASFFLLFGLQKTTHAQNVGNPDDCSGGTFYCLAFPDTTQNTYDARFPAQLLRTKTTAFNFYIYSPVGQDISIGRFGGASQKIHLTAGQILEYNTAELGVPLVTVINTPQTNVLRLDAQYPVIVYGYMMTAFGCDAYTAIPVESWGTEYYTAAWPGDIVRDVFPNGEFNYRTVPKPAGAEILIIAAYDNTEVRILPTDPNSGIFLDCIKCKTVTLKAGEAYLVQSVADTSAGATQQPDIGGTLIQSSKPIGVISGNTRLMLNAGARPSLGENSFKDLAIEWIPPVNQLGTEFAYLPMWDDRRPRQGLDLEESRDAERVRFFATDKATETTVSWYDTNGTKVNSGQGEIAAGGVVTEQVFPSGARYFKTSSPALAVMSPNSVVKFNGTTSYGANYVGASYLSWSTHMVQMVPREQWGSFAPVRAPSLPSSMLHYLNVVTDTNNQFNVYYRQGNSPRQLFPFNRGKILGSDLIWGSITINKGVDYFLEGHNGALFSGYAYGSYRGQEQYRPGGTRKDDDGKGSSISGGGASDPEVLHPSEYEEDVALMYSYPLASSHCIATPQGGGYHHTETIDDCGAMTIHVIPDSEDSPGIRSVTLLSDSSENIRLEFVQPNNPGDIQTAKEFTFRLVPINPSKDAFAILVIKDRSRDGAEIRIVYYYQGIQLDADPADKLSFTDLALNETADEKSITLTNSLSKGVAVKRLSFLLGSEGFRIKRTEPAFNWSTGADEVVLAPGQSLKVWIDITPNDDRTYNDSLRIELSCYARMTIPVQASVLKVPELCLVVTDLDFGIVEIDHSKRMNVEVCNRGEGPITFEDPWLTWLGDDFAVAPAEIDKLKGLTLQKDECLTIQVAFSARDVGNFSTVARFWANTRNCRDTSIWKVRVIDPLMGVAGEKVVAGYAISSVTPNPFTREARIDFRIGKSGRTVVAVYDASGKLVETLLDRVMEQGEQRVVWDAEGEPAGVYLLRIHSGEWSGARQVVLVR